MTDASKQELIEEARTFVSKSHVGLVTARELDRAILLIRKMVETFEQAHTPTDDERLPLIEAATEAFQRHDGAPTWQDDPKGRDAALRWHLRGFEDGLAARRTAVQEPSAEVCAWCPAPARGTAIWQGHDQREPSCGEDNHGMRFERADHAQGPQGEPSDAPTVQLMARKGGKTQALIDSLLGQANERGIRVEVVYPQGEPTDIELLAASNAYMHYKPPYDDLSAFSFAFLDDMRAALRAAYEEGKNR